MKNKIRNILCYFSSISFIFSGLGFLLLSAYPTGVLMLLSGILLLPPIGSAISKRGMQKIKVTTVIAAITLSFILIPQKINTPIDEYSSEHENSISNISTTTIKQIETKVEQKSPSRIIEENILSISNDTILLEDAASTNDTIDKFDQNQTKALEGELIVSFIDVGQGDSILIEQNDNFMLIDAGENGQGDTIINYLKSQGVERLEYIIGTHPHSDHIGSLDDVIHEFSVNKIIFPDVVHTTKTFEDVLDAIASKGMKITKAVAGDEYKLGDATFIIYAPNSENYNDLNNYSVVIKLLYGDTSFLLTGDAEEISENEMISKGYNLSSDVLKIGHHGSTYSSSIKFINAVSPKSSVISVGKNNKYGHPTSETIEKLIKAGINIYRTDLIGTIVATSDGKKIKFNSLPTNDIPEPTVNPTPTVTPDPTPASKPKNQEIIVESITVYITDTGSKYHKEGCRYLKDSKTPISLDKANNDGYGPCGVCKPPKL